LEQYAYTPYGVIVATDDLTIAGDPPTPQNRIGHQGLLFDRYNFPTNPLTDSPFDTAALGLYYNRNRFYSPTIGRYLRNDPNASGTPLIMANGFHGSAPFADFASFDALTLYADGMNLYNAYGNNPLTLADPSGLGVLEFVAGTFLDATNGSFGNFLDNRSLVNKVALGFGLAGAAAIGGAFIVAAAPAIIAATQTFIINSVATATSAAGNVILAGAAAASPLILAAQRAATSFVVPFNRWRHILERHSWGAKATKVGRFFAGSNNKGMIRQALT